MHANPISRTQVGFVIKFDMRVEALLAVLDLYRAVSIA